MGCTTWIIIVVSFFLLKRSPAAQHPKVTTLQDNTAGQNYRNDDESGFSGPVPKTMKSELVTVPISVATEKLRLTRRSTLRRIADIFSAQQ